MRLIVVRDGGVTGMTRTWEADIPERQAEKWLPLLKTGADRTDPAAPDSFFYTISLGNLTAELCESALTPTWQELIDLARNRP